MPALHLSPEGLEKQLRTACADLERRLRSGERTRAERYFALCPLLATHEDHAVDLIYTEFSVREELNGRPTPEEFLARFPVWKERLERQFRIHSMMSHGLAETATDLDLPDVPSLASAEPGPGSRLGAYELLEVIARGGCGVVYRAWQHGLERPVAIKVLLPELARRRGARERFSREARVMASLQHPNIVAVHDIGECQGLIFFSMDYLPAGSLAVRLPAPADSRIALVQLLHPVASAVGVAHAHGVVHCDLKPSNVLLDATDLPVVTDFGLATMPEGDSGDGPLRVVGTPAYMAPEQVSGLGHVSPATDVWALGVILYEILSGRRPFHATTFAQLSRLICAAEPEPLPSDWLTPPALIQLCWSSLMKSPDDRPGNATIFAEQLRRALPEAS
jgi:eukaryotic-like serine/threonine-protein kinase